MKKSIRNLSTVTTIGLDIAKNVFQVHGVDAAGAVVVAKSIRRAQPLAFFASLPPCLVGIEACGSAGTVAGLLRFAVLMLGGDRGVQFGAPLGARADRFGPPGEADHSGLCEAGSLPSGLTRGCGATRTTRSTRRRSARR